MTNDKMTHPLSEGALIPMDATADDLPPSASDSVRSIFVSVQERIALLEREQIALDLSKERLRDSQCALAIEQQRSHEMRRTFLECSIHSHSIDVEMNKMQDKIRDRTLQTTKLKELLAEIADHITQQEREWRDKYEVEFARHEGNLEIYKKYLLGVINAQRDRDEYRSSNRELAIRLAAQKIAELDSLLQTQNDTQNNVARLTETEDETNQQVESLARQVRSALDKRLELRAVLREAQRAQKHASEETERLGSVYRDLSRV